MWRLAHPKLIVVSAPSGAGKSTLCRRLLSDAVDIIYSISCTTRAPRGSEVDGQAYHFLSEDEFTRRVADGAFLEHAAVHGNHYGTLRESVAAALAAGRSVIMDIDVQGAAQIRRAIVDGQDESIGSDCFIDIFIAPPSLEVLSQRLYGRGEDAPAVIEQRLCNAAREMEAAPDYRHVVVNDDLEKATQALRQILDAEGGRTELSAEEGT